VSFCLKAILGALGLVFLMSGCSSSGDPKPSGNLQKPARMIHFEVWTDSTHCFDDQCPSFTVEMEPNGHTTYAPKFSNDLPADQFILPNEQLSQISRLLHPYRAGGDHWDENYWNGTCDTHTVGITVRWIDAGNDNGVLQQDMSCTTAQDLTRVDALLAALRLLPIERFVKRDFNDIDYRQYLDSFVNYRD
jgi:hypothetical protein